MTSAAAVGFWSYAHDDNRGSRGKVLELARHISDEYELLSGEPLDAFIDRNDLAWGDNWGERIDSRLAATTFFIPVITPKYFTRTECRRELLQFFAQSKSLGLEEFLLPILFVSVRDLTADNEDEAVAIIARTQYADWTRNRLLEPSSSEYQQEVNALATRLLDIASRMNSIQRTNETPQPKEDVQKGIAELLQEISDLMPAWLDAVIEDQTVTGQVKSSVQTWEKRSQRFNKNPSARVANLIRLGSELKPLFNRHLNAARTYSARSIEIDPLITSAIRFIQDNQDDIDLFEPLQDGIEEAAAIIRREKEKGHIPFENFCKEHIRYSKIYHELLLSHQASTRYIIEGNDIVKRWHLLLSETSARQENASMSSNAAATTPHPGESEPAMTSQLATKIDKCGS